MTVRSSSHLPTRLAAEPAVVPKPPSVQPQSKPCQSDIERKQLGQTPLRRRLPARQVPGYEIFLPTREDVGRLRCQEHNIASQRPQGRAATPFSGTYLVFLRAQRSGPAGPEFQSVGIVQTVRPGGRLGAIPGRLV
eukprot:g81883.t1